MTYATRTAFRLMRSANVQVLLLEHLGTFAKMFNLSVSGQDFKEDSNTSGDIIKYSIV